ncbi:MAG: acetyl-CoA carboxylase carboxyl transferase subunit beta [Candidatus Hydrogenedens sp.]|nr:acetyl-CoA carboxylase carboxyl transferase subunit beta [Candidatus Hydrogenedens sp.]
MKCVSCGTTVYRSEVEERLHVCPTCGHHYRVGAHDRIGLHFDRGSFEETHGGITAADPLEFAAGEHTYASRVDRARQETGLNEALVTGFARIEGNRVALGVMDSRFVMASMGGAVGEKFCRLCADAIQANTPLLLFAASGGARMQEGILALMQMAKTADAVSELNEAGIPYIVVLTDPTSGGVFASFATLGDVLLAEPKAYIGFAGARLIQGALHVKLPQGFQTSEYQYQNGQLDRIVPRSEMRATLAQLVRLLHPEGAVPQEPAEETEAGGDAALDAQAEPDSAATKPQS